MDKGVFTSDVPQHIAVIMDGNGRWAKARHLPRAAGHSRGVEAVRRVIQTCIERGVQHLTLFAFSSENWNRPAEEVSLLMRLFVRSLKREAETLAANGVRLRVIGDTGHFDPSLRRLIDDAQTRCSHGGKLTLNVCASYGGRWDIAQAAISLAQDVAAGSAHATAEEFRARLALSGSPDPDLLIRTGGESRISNFLLWQLAYAELYFTETLWPDFDREALECAITWYAARERRFGRTSEQLKPLTSDVV